jgi:phytoene desaturase
MLDTTFVRSTLQIPSHRQPHAVVIGSGFGGLAAAVRLGAKGYCVTLLEKLDAPGGRAYVHRQDGFTFDAGPTIVTAPFLFEELWKLCGRRMSDDVTLVPVSPFYRIRFQGGSHFDYSGDAGAMRAEIARFSPGDVDAYDAYMKASEEIFKVGFERLGDVPFSRWTDMAKIAPEMIRLSSYRSVYSLVSKFFRDRRQSLHREFDLLPDRVSGAALGRPFCSWRHRSVGRRAGQADRRAGRQAPLQRGGP